MIWKNESQFSGKVRQALEKKGHLVYKIEVGVGGTCGLPDLMIINKHGTVRFIELKCVKKDKNEPVGTYILSKRLKEDWGLKTRFKFNGYQQFRFTEMNINRKDVWIMVAEKGTQNISAVLFSVIRKSAKSGKVKVTQSKNLGYLLKTMGY